MKAKTSIKVGYVGWQHNETLVGCQAKRSFNVKTNIKAGVWVSQHNETLVCA
jgi:hypothetical protein